MSALDRLRTSPSDTGRSAARIAAPSPGVGSQRSAASDLRHCADPSRRTTLLAVNASRIHPNEHLVSEGRVHCQKVRRDVSVETCWMCDRLIGFDVDEKTEIVRCSANATILELAG